MLLATTAKRWRENLLVGRIILCRVYVVIASAARFVFRLLETVYADATRKAKSEVCFCIVQFELVSWNFIISQAHYSSQSGQTVFLPMSHRQQRIRSQQSHGLVFGFASVM